MGLTYQLAVALTQFIAGNYFRLQIHGRENMVHEGAGLLAMNHQSFLDPPLAAICCDQEVHFLARKSLFEVPILGTILHNLNVIGVERDGADMSALKNVIRILKAGGRTLIFPEGTRTRDGALAPAQAGLGLVVAKTLAPVVPMRVFGAFAAFPRTQKFPRRRSISIVIGQPLRFTPADFTGDLRAAYQRASDAVMDAIGRLRMPEAPHPE